MAKEYWLKCAISKDLKCNPSSERRVTFTCYGGGERYSGAVRTEQVDEQKGLLRVDLLGRKTCWEMAEVAFAGVRGDFWEWRKYIVNIHQIVEKRVRRATPVPIGRLIFSLD